jgi:hypothetical protein
VVALKELSITTDCHMGVTVGTVCSAKSVLPPTRCT